jgi:hypothetical protein
MTYLNPFDFGATFNGTTNDSAAWQACINAAAPTHADIIHPGGCSVVSGLVWSSRGRILAQSGGASLKTHGSFGLKITSGLTTVEGVEFIGNGCDNGILVAKAADNYPCVIRDGLFSGFTKSGIAWASGDCPVIEGNTLINNTTHILFSNDGRNGSILNNSTLGGTGIVLDSSSIQMEGSLIANNHIMAGLPGARGLIIKSGLEIDVYSNIIDQVINTQGVVIDAGARSVANIKLSNNWIGRQGGQPADYGVYIAGPVSGFRSVNDTFAGWQQAGLFFNGSPSAQISGPIVRDANFLFADPCGRDIQVQYTNRMLIDGCEFHSAAPIVESGPVSGYVTGCMFPSGFGGGSLKYGQQR